MRIDRSESTRRVSSAARRLVGLRPVAVLALLAVVALPGVAANSTQERREGISDVRDASKVVRQIMGAKDSGIPQDLLEDAECVAVFPDVIKGAFIFGGAGGSGCAVARDPATGRFGQPLFLKIGGGSVGFQRRYR